jgi:hypothetical protein
MSTVEVDKIIPATGTTLNIGESGDTIAIPSGATITNSGTATGFGGITVADQWYMDTSFSGNGDITSNWTSTMPYTGYGVIGSAVTESSGVFTFPSTGIWRVQHITNVQIDSGADDFIVQIQYNFSTNSGSSYDSQDAPLIGHYNPSTLVRLQHSFFANYDVTDASTARFKMSTSSIGSGTTIGAIFLAFTRLGDT